MNIRRMGVEELKKKLSIDDMSKYLKIVTAEYRGKVNLLSVVENVSGQTYDGQLCSVNVYMQDPERQ